MGKKGLVNSLYLFCSATHRIQLIGADLNNKGLLIGESDAHYLGLALLVAHARIRVSFIKIFMPLLPFSVAKIDVHTQQDMTSLRNKLEQLATCSHWYANASLINVRHSHQSTNLCCLGLHQSTTSRILWVAEQKRV